MKLYHPVPFDGNWSESSRTKEECEARWVAIRNQMGDLNGKTMLDYGCANGYFLFRFIQDGGLEATGIEIDYEQFEFINKIAAEHDVNVKCVRGEAGLVPNTHYDIGLYLDLHFHNGIDKIQWFKDRTSVLFASPAGGSDGVSKSKLLKIDLEKIYSHVEPIHTGFVNRTIFYCK